MQGDRGHDNYILVDVTPKKLTLAIDDAPSGAESSRELGGQIEYTSDTDEAR